MCLLLRFVHCKASLVYGNSRENVKKYILPILRLDNQKAHQTSLTDFCYISRKNCFHEKALRTGHTTSLPHQSFKNLAYSGSEHVEVSY